MVVFMRSNDAYIGLTHDIFAFTMLQELVARTIMAELGSYIHLVGSLHLYDRDQDAAVAFVQQGFTSARPMPPMPNGDPWPAVEQLIVAEADIRHGASVDPDSVGPSYWADLVRLLSIFSLKKTPKTEEVKIAAMRRSMHSDVYDVFLNDNFGVLGN